MGLEKRDNEGDTAFQKLNDAIFQASILVASNWKKVFQGDAEASQTGDAGTLTQLDEDGQDLFIALSSKKLSRTEADYIKNDRENFGVNFVPEIFMCYREGSCFEIFTENQVLKYFFTKKKLSQKEA